MVTRPSQDDGRNLAIRTDVRGKGVAFAGHEGIASAPAHREGYAAHQRTASVSSQSDDEQVNTLLSASSLGNTDTISSSGISGHSTTMTSATTYDDRPSASSPTTTPPYAHPSLTLLELVSNTASSSALPDSFDVNVSRRGSYVAVYSASTIWLIKTVELPRLWARTLQVKRKPVAIDITEDGFLLAVLSRPSQVDLYEIHGEGDKQIKKRRTIMLVHEASSIVISPDTRILITGNKFGIEVVAIGPGIPETARRTLSGPAGDALEFSDDGRTLLITGYARKSDGSALFVLPGLYDGPLTEEGEPIPQPPEAAWTGSVLFPETARIARQATLLPDADTGTFNELFAFNAEEDSWGIYDIACQRFTQRKMFLPDHQRWTRSEFVDDAMPAVSPNADLAAVALRMRGTTNIWVYEVPGWEYKPSEKAKTQAPIQPCFCIPIPNDDAGTLQEICVLRWVRLNVNIQRLVAVGNSSILPGESDVPGAPLGSKGVLIVLDFDKRKPTGSPPPTPLKTEYDLDPLCPGEMLPEGSIDFDREVELVRTRTLAQRRAQDRDRERNEGSRRHSRIGSTPVQRARTTANRAPARPPLPTEESEELTAEEAQAAFEVPYDNQQPRSQMSLARAATVAAVSPANRRHLRALPFRPLEYRRADGQRELPHESDADNWVPPPPAYTATAAAAASVSLSHPDAPPVPRLQRGSTSSSIPPVPTMSATINPSQLSPSNPYQNRQQSISSINLSSPPQQPQERRPSLLHPSTYPSRESSGSTRRRSSAAQSPPQMSYIASPQFQNPQLPPSAHANATRRPSLRPRRAVESNVDLRAPPVINPDAGRRGSAPNVAAQRRPVPLFSSPTMDRMSVPQGSQGAPARVTPNSGQRRGVLPRLVPPEQTGQRLPLSAPPRTDSLGPGYVQGRPQPQMQSQVQSQMYSQPQSQSQMNLQSGRTSRMDYIQSGRASRMTTGRETPGPERKAGKKKMQCIVM
ncbi:Nn.00g012330.m01.CDS01 [Neocucurbitaria sp. VM-36]